MKNIIIVTFFFLLSYNIGTQTIKISGSTSGGDDNTIVCEKPWKDSFELRTYNIQHSTVQEAETEIEDYNVNVDYKKKSSYVDAHF